MLHTRVFKSVALVASILLYSIPFAASAAVCVTGTNCVPNPGFETGFSVGAVANNTTANSWSANSEGANDAVFSIVSDAHTPSTRAGKVAMTSYTNGHAKWVPETATVQAGQFYNISFWYKSSTSTSAFIEYNGGAPLWFRDLPVSSTYTQVTSQILVPQGMTSLQVFAELASVGELTIDDMVLELQSATPVFTHGLVTLTFDDGWETFNDVAAPIMSSSNVSATAYIITGLEGSNIGATPNGGYMNTQTIQTLQQSGFEIGAHTRNHVDLVKDDPVAFGYADRAAMWASEINGSRTDLLGAGFSPVSSIAYPYGSYDASVEAAVQAAGFTAARSVDQGFNYTTTDKFALKIMPINDQSTVAGINALIDKAMSDKTWLILMFHHVRTGTETTGAQNAACVDGENPAIRDFDCTTSAVLQGIVNHMATLPSGSVVTMNQGVAAMAAPHTITASSDTNGTITPTGAVQVMNGASQPFTLTANAGYHFGTLLVDGVAAATTSANTYTFSNVTAAHTIAVTYEADVDITAPSVTLTSVPSVATTSSKTFAVTAAFSEPVTGFDATDVVGGAVTNFVAASSTVYTFTVTVANDGPVTISVPAAAAQDLAVIPNTSLASNALNFIVDTTVPVITLTGDMKVSTPVGQTYTDAGATVTNGGVLATTSTVVTSVVGEYTYTYTAVNGAGTAATPVTRTVVVTELGSMSDEASVNVTASSFTVTWTTAASGTSRVVYDTVSHSPLIATSSNYGYAFSTAEDTSTTKTHSVTVSGLNANTKYYFRAVSHGSPEVVAAEMSVTTGSNPVPVVTGGGGGGGGGGGNGPVTGALGSGSLIPGASISVPGGSSPAGGSVLGASTFKFLNNLSKGMRHGDVVELQKRLVAEGFLTIDSPTNYFGSLTFMAVKKYQAAHGIDQVGNVGPKTRAALNGSTGASTDSAKQALIDALKAKLAELMKKIADLLAAGGSSSTASSTAPVSTTTTSMMSTSTASVATSTPVIVGTSTAMMTGTTTNQTASSTQQ